MEAKQYSKVTVRCDVYGGLALYSGKRRISTRGLTPVSALYELEALGLTVRWSDLPLSAGVRVEFTLPPQS